MGVPGPRVGRSRVGDPGPGKLGPCDSGPDDSESSDSGSGDSARGDSGPGDSGPGVGRTRVGALFRVTSASSTPGRGGLNCRDESGAYSQVHDLLGGSERPLADRC